MKRSFARPPNADGTYRVPSQAAPPPLLPVYVIHWNAPEWCAATVRSLRASEGIEVEVHVVDNGPFAASTKLRSLLPEPVRIIETGANRGFTGAGNLAFAHWLTATASGAAAIASHDIRLQPESLAQMRRALDGDPSIGIIGAAGGHHGAPTHDAPMANQVTASPWVSGSLMIFRRSCAEEIGGFDEHLGSYVEDVDICFRAWDAGWWVGRVEGIRMGWNGSRSPNARTAIEANWILLTLKRAGPRAAVAQSAVVTWSAIRSLAGAGALWRPASARRASRRRTAQLIGALPLAWRRCRSEARPS